MMYYIPLICVFTQLNDDSLSPAMASQQLEQDPKCISDSGGDRLIDLPHLQRQQRRLILREQHRKRWKVCLSNAPAI